MWNENHIHLYMPRSKKMLRQQFLGSCTPVSTNDGLQNTRLEYNSKNHIVAKPFLLFTTPYEPVVAQAAHAQFRQNKKHGASLQIQLSSCTTTKAVFPCSASASWRTWRTNLLNHAAALSTCQIWGMFSWLTQKWQFLSWHFGWWPNTWPLVHHRLQTSMQHKTMQFFHARPQQVLQESQKQPKRFLHDTRIMKTNGPKTSFTHVWPNMFQLGPFIHLHTWSFFSWETSATTRHIGRAGCQMRGVKHDTVNVTKKGVITLSNSLKVLEPLVACGGLCQHQSPAGWMRSSLEEARWTLQRGLCLSTWSHGLPGRPARQTAATPDMWFRVRQGTEQQRNTTTTTPNKSATTTASASTTGQQRWGWHAETATAGGGIPALALARAWLQGARRTNAACLLMRRRRRKQNAPKKADGLAKCWNVSHDALTIGSRQQTAKTSMKNGWAYCFQSTVAAQARQNVHWSAQSPQAKEIKTHNTNMIGTPAMGSPGNSTCAACGLVVEVAAMLAWPGLIPYLASDCIARMMSH